VFVRCRVVVKWELSLAGCCTYKYIASEQYSDDDDDDAIAWKCVAQTVAELVLSFLPLVTLGEVLGRVYLYFVVACVCDSISRK